MTLPPSAEKFLDLVKAKKREMATNRLKQEYAGLWTPDGGRGPYGWQKRFHDLGATHNERIMLAANQCLAGRQTVSMADGSLKRADQIVVGDMVLTKGSLIHKKLVAAVFIKPESPIYKLTFRKGQTLECSGEHKIYTTDGWMRVADCVNDNAPIEAPFDTWGWTTIKRWEILGTEKIYDFSVPPFDNYVAGGVVNKNSGKTRTAAAEVSMHATGLYPSWWGGRRFAKPIQAWVCSVTNQDSRDIAQEALLGKMNEIGTGWLPLDNIDQESIAVRQCGLTDVVDTVRIRHISGGHSYLGFKSYQQDVDSFQGRTLDLVWMDEEPRDERIFSELMTRLLVRKGIFMMTRTPLYGRSPIVQHFLRGGPGIAVVNATWDDAPHLDEESKQRQLRNYPEHERATRTQGIPMMGSGGVFPVPDEDLWEVPFEIPSYFALIVGMDFGWQHPGGAVWGAYDADQDTWHLYDCYKASGQNAEWHAEQINKRDRGLGIPVAWPHDGEQKDKGSGKQLSELYRQQRVKMIYVSARWKDETGGAQGVEPAIQEMLLRMQTGRFKVFKTEAMQAWMEEKRMYHRENGQPVAIDEDLLSATRMIIMMRRYASRVARGIKQERVDNSGYNPLEDWSSSGAAEN